MHAGSRSEKMGPSEQHLLGGCVEGVWVRVCGCGCVGGGCVGGGVREEE